jgi:E1-E2 ATPase
LPEGRATAAVVHADVLASGSPVPTLAPHDVFAELTTSPRGLTAGDAISADCRLVEAHDLLVEMAALTGESRPVPRIAEAVPAERLADARNCVFTGTSVTNGTARAVVVATGLGTPPAR